MPQLSERDPDLYTLLTAAVKGFCQFAAAVERASKVYEEQVSASPAVRRYRKEVHDRRVADAEEEYQRGQKVTGS